MNLLQIGWFRWALKHKGIPLIPQVLMGGVLALLVVGGLGVATQDAALSRELRNTNLANLVVWSYWWPLIIIAAVVLGRLWCTVCPIELVTFGVGRAGLRRSVPRFFRSGWVMTGFYALVLIAGVHMFDIHRVPHRMALYLLTLVGVGVIVSFLYGKRAFCSYVCPVGYLLGLYSMISPFEWRTDDPSVCKDCKTKDCVTKTNHYRANGRSCTSELYPATIRDNRRCLLCTQCLKACPNDNLRFSSRRPFADFFRSVELRWAEIIFVLLVSGFVVYQVLSEWSVSNSIMMWVPTRVANAVGIRGVASAFVPALVLFVVFPATLFLAVALGARVVSAMPAKASLEALSLLLLPTMAAAHILKSLIKMNTRLPYVGLSLSDPVGLSTAEGITAGSLKLDRSVVVALDPAVTAAGVLLLLTALVAVLLVLAKGPFLRDTGWGTKAVLLVGAVVYWAIFAVTLVQWRL